MKNEKSKSKKITALENDTIELNLCLEEQDEQKPSSISDPYVIYIENNFKTRQKVILFGDAVFGYEKNFGSDEGIKISTSGRSYAHLLKQSANTPFEAGKWRFQSETSKNLQKEMLIFQVDADGKEFRTKLNLSVLRDAYQVQSDILDVTKLKFVNHNVYFQLELEPRSEMVISIYPIKLYHVLEDKQAIKTIAPRLSALNCAPIIIQSIKENTNKPTKNKVAVKKAVKKSSH